MKNKLFVIFAILFIAFVYECMAKDKNNFEYKNYTEKEDSVLIENKIMHSFSQIDRKDEFYICIKGKSITDGTVIFRITNTDGKEIYHEEFHSNLLINYDFDGNFNSKKDTEKFIKARIKDFFNEKYYEFPAIELDSDFSGNYSEKEIWDDIKSDRTAIGFIYLIGEEDNRGIAFSKKNGKVVMYFSCC